MRLRISGEEQEVPTSCLHIVDYPNDIMNGLLIDLPDQYGFISEHATGGLDLIAEAMEEGAPYYDLSECEVDLTVPPHSWIVNSLSKIVLSEFVELVEG